MTMEKKAGSQIKVLLVDDDMAFLEEMKEILCSAGYDTYVFSEGGRALECIPTIKPDIVFIDLKMPVLNGFQLADRLKKNTVTSHIPLVAMTGCYKNNVHLSLMRSCGMAATLIKPFSIRQIKHKIDAITAG